MYDEDIHSSSEGEEETYGDFKFWQQVKGLAEYITDLVIDNLTGNKDKDEQG